MDDRFSGSLGCVDRCLFDATASEDMYVTYGYTLKSDLTKTSSWLKDEPDGATYLVTESRQPCKLGFVTSQLILMQPVHIDNLARTEQG